MGIHPLTFALYIECTIFHLGCDEEQWPACFTTAGKKQGTVYRFMHALCNAASNSSGDGLEHSYNTPAGLTITFSSCTVRV